MCFKHETGIQRLIAVDLFALPPRCLHVDKGSCKHVVHSVQTCCGKSIAEQHVLHLHPKHRWRMLAVSHFCSPIPFFVAATTFNPHFAGKNHDFAAEIPRQNHRGVLDLAGGFEGRTAASCRSGGDSSVASGWWMLTMVVDGVDYVRWWLKEV